MDNRRLGDAINSVAIVVIAVATASAMLDTPDMFDPLWKRVGFCVSVDPARAFDTEILCCLFLTTSGILLYFFAQSRPDGADELVRMRLSAGAFATWPMEWDIYSSTIRVGPLPPPPVEFKLDPLAIGNIVMLLCFFIGTLRTLMQVARPQVPVILSLGTIVGQAILRVPPELAFTYSQSIILIAGIVDQMLLDKTRKGFSYFLIALQYAPLLVLFGLEGLQCRQLAPFGGHAIYDFYLSVAPFALYYAVNSYATTTKAKQK